jgi:hypothetical protein
MSSIKSYKDLIVWQKSIILVKEIFILTDKFPQSENLLLEVLKILNKLTGSFINLSTSV